MSIPITHSAVFVVSGGARGITAHCVVAMARRYRCAFLLLGRSARSVPETAWLAGSDADPNEQAQKARIIAQMQAQGEKPTPARVQKLLRAIQAEREIDATLDAIAQAGGRAEYLSVDVTDAAAVQAALPPVLARLGPVTGIIHGAGSLADRLIEQKTLADFEQVYAVKIKGLENLLAGIPVEQLAYLVLFGSVAGFYGNIGQSDYALANEVFNKTAHLLRTRYPTCRVVALNWGPWDGGMVTPALKQLFADRDIDLIPIEAGTQMLLAELEASDPAPTQVVIGSPIKALQPTEDTTLRTHRIWRQLSAEANPFLHDHMIGEHAVLPAVFGIAWMCNVCEQLYPGYTFFSYHDFRVFKGIVFDETLAEHYAMDVQELAKDDEHVAFDVLIWSALDNGRQRNHYRGRVVLRRALPTVPVYASFDRSETYVVPGSEFYQNGTLFHGPLFQGIDRTLNISPQRLTMFCRPPMPTLAQQGQFPIQTFNPFHTDIEFQCMLIWVRYYHQAGSLPLSADLVEHFRSIPPGAPFYVSLEVQASTATRLKVQVAVHDDEGRVYMRVSGAEVTISKRLNSMFEQRRLAQLP